MLLLRTLCSLEQTGAKLNFVSPPSMPREFVLVAASRQLLVVADPEGREHEAKWRPLAEGWQLQTKADNKTWTFAVTDTQVLDLTLALAKVLATWSVRLGSGSPVRVGGKRDSSLSLRLAFRLASRLSPSLANLILFMASGPVESHRCTGYMVYLREHIRDSALQDVPGCAGRMQWVACGQPRATRRASATTTRPATRAATFP